MTYKKVSRTVKKCRKEFARYPKGDFVQIFKTIIFLYILTLSTAVFSNSLTFPQLYQNQLICFVHTPCNLLIERDDDDDISSIEFSINGEMIHKIKNPKPFLSHTFIFQNLQNKIITISAYNKNSQLIFSSQLNTYIIKDPTFYFSNLVPNQKIKRGERFLITAKTQTDIEKVELSLDDEFLTEVYPENGIISIEHTFIQDVGEHSLTATLFIDQNTKVKTETIKINLYNPPTIQSLNVLNFSLTAPQFFELSKYSSKKINFSNKHYDTFRKNSSYKFISYRLIEAPGELYPVDTLLYIPIMKDKKITTGDNKEITHDGYFIVVGNKADNELLIHTSLDENPSLNFTNSNYDIYVVKNDELQKEMKNLFKKKNRPSAQE